MTQVAIGAILLLAAATLAAQEPKQPASIDRIWLTHKSHDPSSIVVNWMSVEPGDSVVHFGTTQQYGRTERIDENTTLHHVEIPLAEKNTVYHYRVSSGAQHSAGATFKAYPTDLLRVAVAADWQRKPDLSAVLRDDPHLLLTAGDNIAGIWQACGVGDEDCVTPYSDLIGAYPTLFRSIPFMPALGNHDREIRPRGEKPPEVPVYDIEASAFRRFFELPGDEWKWHFDVPDFGVRFIALDLNHISDQGTTWQTCHALDEDSQQFRWYQLLMDKPPPFVVTLYNERNGSIRNQAKGRWHALFRRGSTCISGFGYYAERAEVDGFPYYNTSLSGTGDRYPDSQSKFLASEDSYILLTFDKAARSMIIEIKNLEGKVLDRRALQKR